MQDLGRRGVGLRYSNPSAGFRYEEGLGRGIPTPLQDLGRRGLGRRYS